MTPGGTFVVPTGSEVPPSTEVLFDSVSSFRIIAAARKPNHALLPPEPGHLSLGVLKRGPHRHTLRFIAADLTSQILCHLSISNGLDHRGIAAKLLQDTPHFVHQPEREHASNAPLDARC